MKKKKWIIVFLLLFGISQIFAAECGDVNSDGDIDIVDALLIAQYYVNLDPDNFDSTLADVNGDGKIDIVDALLVAQYYVGLLPSLPGCVETPVPTPVPTPIPTVDPSLPVGPEGYIYCADEEDTVTFEVEVNVAYGADGHFNYLYEITGTITFNNDTFGDPIYGTVKHGFYQEVGTPTPTPSPTPVPTETPEGWTPTPTPSDPILESSFLRLEVQETPYLYKVIEKSTNQVIVSQATSRFDINGNDYSSQNFTNVNRTDTTITGDITLNGTSQTVQVSFTFTTPKRLEVVLTSSGNPANIKEIFNDQGEHYYGIWEYPVGNDIDNRGADRQLIGFKSQSDNNWCSARAPFYVTSGKYGIYAESMELGHYTIARDNKTSFAFDTPELKYHIIYGPEYKDVLFEYNQLAGPSFMPPDWAFGSIWWRDDDHNDRASGVDNAQENVLDTANQLINHQIPAAAIWIDRPYSSGSRGFGNMDFDSSFPNPQGMINELNQKGYNLLLWIANRTRNKLYDEGKANDYLLYGPNVWPVSGSKLGPAADMKNPDAYEWFKNNLDIYVRMGVKGYKIDRGDEGGMLDSVQNEMVYLFHKMAAEGQRERHGDDHLIFARNVYDKSRQYVGVWSGDPDSDFGGLAISIKNALRCGAMNFPFFGADVGGYSGDNISKELFARWFQLGAYSSMMEILIDPGRVPWYDYDQEMINIARKQCQDHHDLIPYTRSYMYKATQTGIPIMRQLIFEYPNDSSLYDMWDEYLYGSEILVAPVYKNGDRSRSVYLPEGNWLDYNNKSTIYPGPKTITADAPLAAIPLFIKEGAIIPKGDIVKANNSWDNNWSPELNIEVYPAINETSTFDYYTGNEVVQITCLRSGDNITVSFDDLGINGNIKIYADGYNTVSRNGELLNPGSEFTYDSSQKMFSIPFNGNTRINISGTASLFG